MSGSDDPVCNFFRKDLTNKRIRKRKLKDDDDDDDDGGDDQKQQQPQSMGKPKKPLRDNKLYFSSSTADGASDKDSSLFRFESSNEIQVHHDSRATATLETETEFSRDARAIRERVLKQANEALKGKSKGKGDEKVYKGIHGYTDYKAGFRREQTVAGEKASGSHGPLRASAHIRSSARFDYQPDICKDYKETGYCGFGDSCKFMHDRGDYKSGWQLEKEWEESEKARKKGLAMGGGDGGGDDEDDDELPFACYICRQPFQDPVVTKCKHYFCEHCALKVGGEESSDAYLRNDINNMQGSPKNESSFPSGGHHKEPTEISGGYNSSRKQINSTQKAISLPSSPHEFRDPASEISETSSDFLSPDVLVSTWNKVLQSSPFLNKPLLPFQEWYIDFRELTVGTRVGIDNL